MEQERLKQAFNIKEQPEQETETLADDPRLQLARKVLAGRGKEDIVSLLTEISDDIDSGKMGLAQEKIDRAEKIAQENDISYQERLVLKRFKDMIK